MTSGTGMIEAEITYGPAVMLPSGILLEATGDLARAITAAALKEARRAIAASKRRDAEKLMLDAHAVAARAYPEGSSSAISLQYTISQVSAEYDRRWP
jgi:hypothetical protein